LPTRLFWTGKISDWYIVFLFHVQIYESESNV
jgi:hypothetical protein